MARASAILSLAFCTNVALAALPLVDFDRMGRVGLAGAFAGLDLFQGSSSVTYDASTSTLFSRSSDGALTSLGSTNTGGRISAGCTLNDAFYVAGSFSSVDSVSATNIASYSTSSSSFSALGSGGPDGDIDSIYCDDSNNRVWVGGSFATPGVSVAVWDPSSSSWSAPPFRGLSGADSRVLSIKPDSSESSLLFAGSFITSFGNGTIPNGTNNPNVPFSAGASPFSSSLVPIPLGDAEVQGSPSSTESGFDDIMNVLCPSGDDGAGNSWFAADANEALVTVRTFSFISANGVRLGNTFQSNHGTTGFSVTTIPDNTDRTLRYLDPSAQENQTCTDPCPLSTDSSILYQDFLFDEPLSITGVQIKLSEWTGSSPGLHILQLLSSGAFASSVDAENGASCYAPNPSNTTRTGDWETQMANTNIPGTIQSVLVSNVAVGTSASDGPTFTWYPYVSAAGDYEVNMLVPGCTNFQDCGARTSVEVTVFPGEGVDPVFTTISQTNPDDVSAPLYRGPILPSSPDFVATVTMRLADSPEGSGQDGQWSIVADRIELVLTSANVTASEGSGGNGTSSGSRQRGFGLFEWSLDSDATVDATSALSNSSETTLDAAALSLFSDIGLGSGSSTSSVVSGAVQHSSGVIVISGTFSISGGSSNFVLSRDGSLTSPSGNGLNGAVTSMIIQDDVVYIGGSFTDTASRSMDGRLSGVAGYNVASDQWITFGEGVNGAVTSVDFANNRVQLTGNFTQVRSASGSASVVGGLASWDVEASTWVNSGGFLVGSMTFVGGGSSDAEYVAGNVAASQKFGASGLVMLQNSDNDTPQVQPLTLQLNAPEPSSGSSTSQRRSYLPTIWMPRLNFANVWPRQASTDPPSLPDPPAVSAPAVYAGAFWTNSSGTELLIIGGNFSFTPSDSQSAASNLAVFDQDASTLTALEGSQVDGTVQSLLVDGDLLYVGGDFMLSGVEGDGFAVYNLADQQWDTSVPAFQSSSGGVLVRSITTSASRSNGIVVAGTFSEAGSSTCQSVCLWDTTSRQWSQLGSGIEGEVSSIAYAGGNQELLVAGGSIALSDGSDANVAQYSFSNNSWSAVGSSSDIAGPVTAVEVNNGNSSSIFAAGRSDSGSSFLMFFNGQAWSNLPVSLQDGTSVSQLVMVPLQDDHDGSSIIEANRMLLVSGALESDSFGNASSALFDGSSLIPYITSTAQSGTAGFVSALFHSMSTFSFDRRRFLAVGVVILISIAIAAGVVFLLALIGIMWALFSRRHEQNDKLGVVEDDDDDSTNQRPSSMLEHINAATRTAIYGGSSASPFTAFNAGKDGEKREQHSPTHDQDPFGPDASNYLRNETPSDMAGGILGEEQSRPAHARYSFDGAGEGELPLSAGAEVEVLDDRDAAWWYARDIRTGQEGVVPAAYLV